MEVAISVMGRFHAFDLAAQLQRRNHLAQLITSYPVFQAARHEVDRDRVSSIVSNEVMRRLWVRLPQRLQKVYDPRGVFCRHFGVRAARRLRPGADLLVGWSGVSLEVVRRAASLGMTTILERGSSHVRFARDTLTQEYEAHGVEPRVAHPAVMEREIQEYDEADFIAIPSRFVANTFLERGIPEAKLILVPYGVSLSGFSPPERRSPAFRIMHCGLVNLRKGCHYLLQAFHELRIPDAELWFVGRVDPEMQPFIEKWSSPSVRFHGAVPQAELIGYYGQATAFCLASLEDGFGMVIAQAMACGLPVLATTNTGAPDIVRDGIDGFIVPIRDVDALKQKILWFYENREAGEAMGDSALQRVRSGFSWDDYGNRITVEYTRVLDRTPPSPSARSLRTADDE